MDPLQEYNARRDRWRAEQERAQRQFIQLGNWKLAAGIVASAVMFLAVGRPIVSAWWLLPSLLILALLIASQKSASGKRTRAARATRFYQRGMARLQDAWIGKGNAGERFKDPEHVYTGDLDVFGRGSLFELIAHARTASGERTLADWLQTVASNTEVLARQEAVAELSRRLDLREEIAMLGEDVRAEVHESGLSAWGSATPQTTFAPYARIGALLLALAALATLGAYIAGALPIAPFAIVLAVNLTIGYLLRKRTSQIADAVDTPGHDLRIFSLLLERLETERFETPRLIELRAVLNVEGLPVSRRIARLERWVDMMDSSNVPLLRAILPAVLWRLQAAMGIDAWRRRNGRHVGAWVRAVAEFEALSSFASLKFERPQWAFPALLEGDAHFEAQALQHPLMPPATCVPNDVTIGGSLRLLIVSGSNMSGKSTLLRSVGLNAVLAWAGGPVAAQEMHLSPLHVGASIRAVDSLQDNRSRFFAEITRIREIVELTRSEPVLFLLDELLSGTNSHDRRIGASGVVRALVEAGAIGLLTTHDLALAEIESDLGSGAANVHFDDQILAGRIEFDYRLRPGVVTHSNALELMRAIGLRV
jgi:hypothetical protein